MNIFQDAKKDILRLVFSKGFIRRRKVYFAIAATPIIYYCVYYEWDIYHNFWNRNMAKRMKLSQYTEDSKMEPTKEEQQIMDARSRKNYFK